MRAIGRVLRLVVMTGLAALPLSGQVQRCDATWRLEETLRLGSADGDVIQMGVSDVEIGADGRIYLTQYRTTHVTVLSPHGELDHVIGGPSQGPGEFRFAGPLGWLGDTLWVGEFRKIHYFGVDGTEARQVAFRTSVSAGDEVYRVLFARPAEDGTFVGADSDVYGGLRRGYHPVVRLSSDGNLLNELVRLDARRRYIRSDVLGVFSNPFTPRPRPALDPAGRELVLIGEARPEAPTPSFDLVRIGLHGDTLLARQIAYQPVRIGRRESERLLSEYIDFRTSHRGVFETATPAGVRAAIRDEVRVPEYHTPVRSLVVGHDASLWLLREPGPEREDRWEVYDRSGRLEGSLVVENGRSSLFPLMPRLRIIRATRDEVWGETIDDLEVPYLHRYAVRRAWES